MRGKLLFAGAWLIACFCFSAAGQAPSGPATVRSYSIAQKRLLVISTARFIDLITVSNLEEDSLRSMACRITGLPWLLPYTEGLDSATDSPGYKLINSGRTSEATSLLNATVGTNRILLLLQLGITWLHRPTARPEDLDSANHYIREVLRLTSAAKDNRWRNESLLLLADYYYKVRKPEQCKTVLLQLISSGQQEGNRIITARAWQRLGTMKENGDSLNLVYLNNSLALYKQLPSKEKEMELLWNIANRHLRSKIPLAEDELLQISKREKETGFKHTLYTQYQLAYSATLSARYLDALNYVQAALENMQWSGISALEPTFFTRMGATYMSLSKNEEALSWFERALALRRKDTHFFWYKSLLYLAQLLENMGRPAEALSRMQAVTAEFPPSTPWEKMQVASTKGDCFQQLNKPDSADRYYQTILDLSNRYPRMDGQFSSSYFQLAPFYVARGNSKMARLFLNKGIAAGVRNIVSLTFEGNLVYKIDSLEGNYRAALQDHIRYKHYYDSLTNSNQRNKLDELNVKYEAEKKDQDIKLLKQQQLVQRIESRQNRLVRNILIAVAGLFLVIIGLLFSRYRLKQRTNKKLEAQQLAISEQNVALRHLVKEKDWLVKEIHHRVKNNFQTVMGLLGTQCGYLNSEAAITAIRDSQQRIQAMSLIHQRLYRTENLSGISMPDYVNELVDFLRNCYAIALHIHFRLQIEPLILELEHCIPLGLIINEAITNSFKYAFSATKEGVISISFYRTSNSHLLLEIQDNGPGLPTGFDGAQTGSMGMNLMRGLSHEIGATITISAHSGTRIAVEFAYDPEVPDDAEQIDIRPMLSA
jgi:two-component system, sensor histidine kinase PdtaS